jgi:hypothetical protein
MFVSSRVRMASSQVPLQIPRVLAQEKLLCLNLISFPVLVLKLLFVVEG